MNTNFAFATINNDAISMSEDVERNANARAQLVRCMIADVCNADNDYQVVCNADTFVVENDYFKILRHSSHKSFCQIYAKKTYVLVLISSASVDAENDAFKTDCERLSNQKCYARYKIAYDDIRRFMSDLVAYDTRKQTTTSASEKVQAQAQ